MLETYLKDLEEVVNIDCGSNTCDGVTRVAEIMKRHYDEIGFATELVDLGDKAGRGLFATNKPGAEKFDIMFNAHLDTVYPVLHSRPQVFLPDISRFLVAEIGRAHV